MSSGDTRTIVIVGGVAGGASAATRARRCHEAARIIMFEKDAHVSFANCGLPYYLGQEIEERGKLLVATPELFAERFNIEARTHHEVVDVDAARHVVRVRNLRSAEVFEQPYDRLILATGARPIVPPLDGVEAPNVFTLRNLEGTDRVMAFLETHRPARAVVIGAGFIGLEMVEQLSRVGLQTALVELQDQVLPPLDPEMAHVVQTELVQRGVDLHLGDGVAGLEVSEGLATRVRLNSGTRLDADMVILGVGVRPETALAEAAGVELGPSGGIRVDAFMRTSVDAIYAVGDAVEYEHAVAPTPMRMPLGGPANRAGRVAGQHAATDGGPPMAPVAGTAIVRVFEQTAAVTGLSTKLATRLGIESRSVTIAGRHHAGYYPGAQEMLLKLTFDPRSARVLGAQAVGPSGVDKRIDIIATAIRFGATVHDLTGVDLAYAPPFGSAKDPVHMAAFAACNDLDGLVKFLPAEADLGGAQVLDVRTPQEIAAGALPDAVCIPVDELRERIAELGNRGPIVSVCRSGQRAYVAARILSQRGFENVAVLAGGMLFRRHARPPE